MEKTEQVAVVEKKTNGKQKLVSRTKKPPANLTMEAVLYEAIQQDIDPDAMEKLVGLIERREASLAKKEFHVAKSKAQGEMKPVAPKGFNKQTESDYAKIEEVNAMAMPIASKHGFSTSFTEGKSEKDGYIRIDGQLSHSAGHSEPYHIDLPLDQKGIKGTVNKTLIHATGSTFSYGRRYLVIMMFNISVLGEDDDGQAASKAEKNDTLITENNVKKINAMIDKNTGLETIILNNYRVATIELIPKSEFDECVSKIENWKIAMTEKKKGK